MRNYVLPNVVRKFSGVKVSLWHWLEEEIGNQDGSFEINQSKLAEKFDVSRKSIQNALKTFTSANLMEKVESRTGRGNHPLYRLIWTFKEQVEKSATPSRAKKATSRKKQTKGRQWRYYAYKFRTVVEDSSLAKKSQVVVGKILNYLEDKPPDLFKSWLIHLKRWLHGPPVEKTIKDFFVFFHDGLMEIARTHREVERTERRIQKQQKQREKVRQEYENDPPPRLKDFDRFSDYLEATDEWSEGQNDVESSAEQEGDESEERTIDGPTLTELLDEELGKREDKSDEFEDDEADERGLLDPKNQ